MQELIKKITKEYGTNDPYKIAEQMGIFLRSSPLANYRGYCMVDGGLRLIRLNSDDPDYIRKFTLAHELGHVFLHAEANYFALKSTLFASNWQERQADKFAVYLLISDKDIRENPDYTIDDWSKVLGVSRDIIELRF